MDAKKIERVHAVFGAILTFFLLLAEWLLRAELTLSLSFLYGFIFSVIGLHCYRVIAEWTLGIRPFTPLSGLIYLSIKGLLLVTFLVSLLNTDGVKGLVMFSGSIFLIPVVIACSLLSKEG